MRDPAQLEKRIAELEHEVSALRGRGRGVRYRSAAAIGGGAVGYYACGGAAVGEHVVSAHRRDPQAEAFFRQYALGPLCRPR